MNKIVVIIIASIYLIIFCIIVYYITRPYPNNSKNEKYIRDSKGIVDVHEDEDDKTDLVKSNDPNNNIFRKTDRIKLGKKTYKSKKLSSS